MALKILHTADIHLAAPLGFMREKAEQHAQNLRDAFSKSADIAIERKADVFLIAGDLFDNAYPGKVDIAHAIDVISRLMEKKIYVALISGNHDLAIAGGIYSKPEFRNIIGEHFRLFTEARPEQWLLAKHDLTIHARGVKEKQSKESQLAGMAKAPSKYNIALIHGSVDLMRAPDNFPIFQQEMIDKAFDYYALGDWHSTLDVGKNKYHAYYPGSPELVNPKQKGSGNVIWVELGDGPTKIEQIKVGKINVEDVELDIGQFISANQIKEFVLQQASQQKLLNLSIVGAKSIKFEGSLDDVIAEIAAKFFQIIVREKTTLHISELDLENYPEQLISGKFLRLMLAKKNGNEQNDRLVDLAIQKGIRLLTEEDGNN